MRMKMNNRTHHVFQPRIKFQSNYRYTVQIKDFLENEIPECERIEFARLDC